MQEGLNDKAWGLLNRLVIDRPDYIEKTRRLQIELLKSEGRDTSQIQALLTEGK